MRYEKKKVREVGIIDILVNNGHIMHKTLLSY